MNRRQFLAQLTGIIAAIPFLCFVSPEPPKEVAVLFGRKAGLLDNFGIQNVDSKIIGALLYGGDSPSEFDGLSDGITTGWRDDRS